MSSSWSNAISQRPDGWLGGEDILNRQLEPQTFLPLIGQPGLIVRGAAHVLSGDPKAGKSSVLRASILEWVRNDLWVAVLTEEPRGPWVRWIKAFPGEAWYNLSVLHAFDQRDYLSDVLALHAEQRIDVLVVDTARGVLSIEDENDASKVRATLRPWTSFAYSTGATLILTHHNRKAGGSRGQAVAGSADWVGAVDAAIDLRVGENGVRTLRAVGRYDEDPPVVKFNVDRGTHLVAIHNPNAGDTQTCDTEGCDNLAYGGRKNCSTCRSRKHRAAQPQPAQPISN